MLFRQGDVGNITAEIPANAEKLEVKEVILAYGEVTGHKHRFDATHVDEFKTETERFYRVNKEAKLAKLDENTYEILEEGAILFHEEHDPITPPVGDFRIIQQQEYELKSWRNVVD